jgi:hypothetical protein
LCENFGENLFRKNIDNFFQKKKINSAPFVEIRRATLQGPSLPWQSASGQAHYLLGGQSIAVPDFNQKINFRWP